MASQFGRAGWLVCPGCWVCFAFFIHGHNERYGTGTGAFPGRYLRRNVSGLRAGLRRRRWIGLSRRLPFLLQLAKRAIGSLVHAMEAGFIARQEGKGTGLVSQRPEGKRKLRGGIRRASFFGFGLLADYFTV